MKKKAFELPWLLFWGPGKKEAEKEHFEFVLHAYQVACASGLTKAQARRAAQEASIVSAGGVLNKDEEERPVTSTSKYRAS